MEHVGWNELLPKPYFIDADKTLFEHFSDVTREGITIAAPGFYAPQGRWVRLEPQDAELNAKIESFDYHGRRITNFEMEGSALAGLAALMGHRRRDHLHDHRTAYRPECRHRLQALRAQNDLDGARQIGSIEISNPYNRK